MSFISRQELRDLLPNAEQGISTEQFDAINRVVSELIIDITGATMPDSPENAPSWSKLPACLLFHRLSVIKQPKPTPESLEDSRANYKQAIELLARHATASSSTNMRFGTVKERFVW